MTYIQLNVNFCDSNDPQEDCYTLYGKSNIRPELVTTTSFAHPIIADSVLYRNPQYPHSPYIPADVMSNITFPNNGWAWIYNSNQPDYKPLYPCYNDILAMNESNSISTMAELIRLIAGKRLLDAQANVIQILLEAELNGFPAPAINPINVICKLPDSIKIYAKYQLNNEWHHLFIFGKFTNGQTSIINFITCPFNQPFQRTALTDFQLSNKKNILTSIAESIRNFENKHQTKVFLTNFSPSNNLVIQPVN